MLSIPMVPYQNYTFCKTIGKTIHSIKKKVGKIFFQTLKNNLSQPSKYSHTKYICAVKLESLLVVVVGGHS